MARVTFTEVVREVLRDEHGDVIRESVRAVTQEPMEAWIQELTDAERDERRGSRDASQRLPAQALGYAGWGDRVADREMRQGSYS
ncbi:MAG: hypothetical protein M3376_04865 [Actinomycetota bacterium]|nr:hypothetical protein [Actinomycetota bacterium]